LVLVAGIALAMGWRGNAFAFSAGLACIGAASFLLVFDLIADQRAAVYLEALRILQHRVD
jgi:hypothetical protein